MQGSWSYLQFIEPCWVQAGKRKAWFGEEGVDRGFQKRGQESVSVLCIFTAAQSGTVSINKIIRYITEVMNTEWQ